MIFHLLMARTSLYPTAMSEAPELNHSDRVMLNVIQKWVWSGFYDPEQVDSMINDYLEEGAHEELLRSAVESEFAKKHEAEMEWPENTDCDRLDAVFETLDQRKILCLENSGSEISDGHQEAFEVLSMQPGHDYFGYCFYHDQDVNFAIDGRGLLLAFNHVDGDVSDKLKVGMVVKEELQRAGFALDWDGTIEHRIKIINIEWKRRYRNGK